MTFEFATPTRIIFGSGAAKKLPELAHSYGKKILVVTGRDPGRFQHLLNALDTSGNCVTIYPIAGEPTVDEVRIGASIALKSGAEVVIGLGGGSAVDAGKAIAAMTRQPHDLLHYLEVVGQGNPLNEPPLPYIAVPTTAGTGAEATRNAVLASPEHGVKVSLRHATMLPTVAVIDPELALNCPAHVTAASGMDALIQCLEAYVSTKAQPMTDLLCGEGIRRAARALESSVKEGQNLQAREDMALAALYGGIALANAGLGAVHGFAAPLGGSFCAPHGAICAALIAPVWRANWAVIQASSYPEAKARFEMASQWLLNNTSATPEQAGAFLQKLTQRLNIPHLAHHGIQEADFDEVADKAAQASSMKGNPVPLPKEILLAILHEAL